MLPQEIDSQLVWPPVAIGRATAGGVADWTLGFGVRHVSSPYD
jgi:hypothetical protein